MIKEKSCGAIVFKDGKVLLIKHNAGHYAFPKGHTEDGETEKETETPKTEMPTWTGDSDIDFLVNLLKKAEVSISKRNDGDRFITLIKAILD